MKDNEGSKEGASSPSTGLGSPLDVYPAPASTVPVRAGLPLLLLLLSRDSLSCFLGEGKAMEKGWSPFQEEYKWSKLYSILSVFFFSEKFKHINGTTDLNKIF